MENKIAVLLAAYNGEKYIKEMLESLLAQTGQDFVCYIHDDGSKDNTAEIIREFCGEHSGNFRILDGARTGSAKDNFMFMLARVDADVYMFADQDDVWLPEKIEKSMQALEDMGDEPSAVYSDVSIADENLDVIAKSFYEYSGINPRVQSLQRLFESNVCIGHTMMINRALRDMAVRINKPENILMHDWWCALIAYTCGNLKYIDEPLSLYRQHGGNSMGAEKEKSGAGRLWFLKSPAAFKEWKKSKRFNMDIRRKTAESLALVLPKDNKYYEFVNKYAAIASEGKIERVRFYKENELIRDKIVFLLDLLFI